ncbi:uncharacterized protein Tco025E_01591 [Trypanosoma conorhini]|uniref:Uncharacterized protein n=1 Tax=Trypanosoma conorhini TaxID=83891 RepID=A0A3S5IUJ0_9TRYP|nr:uncharacterized protein Tco025E_01591 [Trypanosoma conorhini]RNF26146.1 hypothetical protein Tco025E_01591 [Trypanosoma conorhini]
MAPPNVRLRLRLRSPGLLQQTLRPVVKWWAWRPFHSGRSSRRLVAPLSLHARQASRWDWGTAAVPPQPLSSRRKHGSFFFFALLAFAEGLPQRISTCTGTAFLRGDAFAGRAVRLGAATGSSILCVIFGVHGTDAP